MFELLIFFLIASLFFHPIRCCNWVYGENLKKRCIRFVESEDYSWSDSGYFEKFMVCWNLEREGCDEKSGSGCVWTDVGMYDFEPHSYDRSYFDILIYIDTTGLVEETIESSGVCLSNGKGGVGEECNYPNFSECNPYCPYNCQKIGSERHCANPWELGYQPIGDVVECFWMDKFRWYKCTAEMDYFYSQKVGKLIYTVILPIIFGVLGGCLLVCLAIFVCFGIIAIKNKYKKIEDTESNLSSNNEELHEREVVDLSFMEAGEESKNSESKMDNLNIESTEEEGESTKQIANMDFKAPIFEEPVFENQTGGVTFSVPTEEVPISTSKPTTLPIVNSRKELEVLNDSELCSWFENTFTDLEKCKEYAILLFDDGFDGKTFLKVDKMDLKAIGFTVSDSIRVLSRMADLTSE